MKVFVLFILIIIHSNVSGQAKQLNKLLKQYVLNDFRWKVYPPLALQNSEEFVVPHIIYPDTLFTIKWKDIDSVKIFDFPKGYVRIVVHGKFTRHQKCKAADTCSIKYFDSLYHPAGFSDSVFMPLSLRTHGGKLLLTNTIRKKFRKAFQQVSSAPFREYYRPLPPPYVTFDRKTKEIIIGFANFDDDRSSYIRINYLRNARKFVFSNSSTGIPVYKIESFILYIVRPGLAAQEIINQGAEFNEELLQLLQKIEPGTSLIFDQIKVIVPDGSWRTIQCPGFIAK